MPFRVVKSVLFGPKDNPGIVMPGLTDSAVPTEAKRRCEWLKKIRSRKLILISENVK